MKLKHRLYRTLQYLSGIRAFQPVIGGGGVYILLSSHPPYSTTWHWAIDWYAPWAHFGREGKFMRFSFRKQALEERISK